MQTTLKRIREQVLRRRAWASTGTTFNNNVRDAANQALAELSSDLPSAINPTKFHQVVYTQYKSTDTDVNRYIEATADERVLRFTTIAGNQLGDTGWFPTVDGSWNGIMWIEVKTPTNVWVRHRSMEFFKVAALSAANDEYYVSIDRPWRNSTDDSMEFRIWQEYFYLPARVTELVAPIRVWDANRYLIYSMNTTQQLENRFYDFQGDVTGPPQLFGRANDFEQVPSASTAPTITAAVTSWLGDAQEGKFRFCITRFRGATHQLWQKAPSGQTQDPVLESEPSPESTAFNHASGSNAGKAMTISFTSIDQQLEFAGTGGLRDGHSGYGTRIWVARDLIRTAGAGTLNAVDADGVFYLLDEVSGETTSYTWDGSVVPDYSRRLQASNGYYPWKLYPIPDQNYELDIEGFQAPQELVHDQDSPPLNEKFIPAYENLLLSILCEMDGADLSASSFYRQRYDKAIRMARSELGNPTGRVEITPFNPTGNNLRFRIPVRMRIV